MARKHKKKNVLRKKMTKEGKAMGVVGNKETEWGGGEKRRFQLKNRMGESGPPRERTKKKKEDLGERDGVGGKSIMLTGGGIVGQTKEKGTTLGKGVIIRLPRETNLLIRGKEKKKVRGQKKKPDKKSKKTLVGRGGE